MLNTKQASVFDKDEVTDSCVDVYQIFRGCAVIS